LNVYFTYVFYLDLACYNYVFGNDDKDGESTLLQYVWKSHKQLYLLFKFAFQQMRAAKAEKTKGYNISVPYIYYEVVEGNLPFYTSVGMNMSSSWVQIVSKLWRGFCEIQVLNTNSFSNPVSKSDMYEVCRGKSIVSVHSLCFVRLKQENQNLFQKKMPRGKVTKLPKRRVSRVGQMNRIQDHRQLMT